MRRVLISILLAATSIPAMAEEPVDPAIAAAELRKKIADAEAAEADAEKAKYEKQQAAAEAKFGFLPKSPATEGKVTLHEGSGKLESTLLMAAALQKAAERIAAQFKTENGLLLVEGDGGLDNGQYIAFQLEALGIEDAMTTALGQPIPETACAQSRQIQAFDGGVGAGALVSALSGMLRTDIEIRNINETVTSAQLVRALLARAPAGRFILPQQRPATQVSTANPVAKTLCRMRLARTAVEERLSQFSEKPTGPEMRKKAQMTLAAGRYDEWMTRLTKSDTGVPPLAAIYMQSLLFEQGTKVLRVWVDKSGGTILTRRNLWTSLGAPAVGITGGLVASYAKIDAKTGAVEKAGFMYCNTELASLRTMHRSRQVTSNCIEGSSPQ